MSRMQLPQPPAGPRGADAPLAEGARARGGAHAVSWCAGAGPPVQQPCRGPRAGHHALPTPAAADAGLPGGGGMR